MQIHKGPGRVLLRDHPGFHGILGFTPLLLGGLLQDLEGDGGPCSAGFAASRGTGHLPLRPRGLAEVEALALKSHEAAAQTGPRGEVGVRGPPGPGHQVVDGHLHLRGIIPRNLGASSWLEGGKKLSTEKDVGWSRRQRMVEKMVPEVATGKEGGGWKKGLSPDLFRPNTDGARDRSPRALDALQELESFLRNFLKTLHRMYVSIQILRIFG